MINQPVFAFANVEDYQALSQILVEDKDVPRRFFGRIQKSPDGKLMTDPATQRAAKNIWNRAARPEPFNDRQSSPAF